MINQLKFIAIVSIALFTSSCNGQINKDLKGKGKLVDEKIEPFQYGAGDVVKRGYLDKSGNMWFATTKEGVFKYDGKTFTNISTKDGLCSDMVDAIIEDDNGLMWFGTAKGLCSYDGAHFVNIPLPQEDTESVSPETGLPSRKTEIILSLIQANNGDFWIGSDASGAYRYDGEAFTSYLRFEGRVQPDDHVYNNCITSIIEDSEGHVWISSFTHGGLNEYDGNKMIHHALKDGYGDGMISTSYMDSSENLWFGTRNGGIYKYDGKTFEKIVDAKTGESIAMASIVEDKNGTIWIGSFARKGVYKYDGESIVSLDIKGSEQLNDIKCIATDKEGNIWFGGRYGILYRYDGKELKDFTQIKRGE
jgi:ligand-binding sensor domain-containing protein